MAGVLSFVVAKLSVNAGHDRAERGTNDFVQRVPQWHRAGVLLPAFAENVTLRRGTATLEDFQDGVNVLLVRRDIESSTGIEFAKVVKTAKKLVSSPFTPEQVSIALSFATPNEGRDNRSFDLESFFGVHGMVSANMPKSLMIRNFKGGVPRPWKAAYFVTLRYPA